MIQFAFKLFAVICWYGWQGSLKDGHRLKLGKIGPTFLGFNAMPAEITKIIIMASAVLPY